jgi:hypothetical protein
MSELKACCPFCGKSENVYDYIQWKKTILRCDDCGGEAPEKTWNRRVLSWVPVAERLPEKNAWYCVMTNLSYRVMGYSPLSGWPKDYIGEITHWLEDHTFEGEK